MRIIDRREIHCRLSQIEVVSCIGEFIHEEVFLFITIYSNFHFVW